MALFTDRTTTFHLGEERRYPLDLSIRSSPIRSLYEAASRERWDPERVVDWGRLSAAGYRPEARRAGALVWSHRAWLEYRGIRESETALVRLCIERARGSDVKYFLSSRGTAKAVATETAWLAAAALDRYLVAAPSSALASVLADDTARRGLDVNVNADAFVIGQLLVVDVVDLACAQLAFERTTDPDVAEALRYLIRDKVRHVAFGWEYARAWRSEADVSSDQIAEVAGMSFERERTGLHCPCWLDDSATGVSAELVEAYELAASAGLGAAPVADLADGISAALDELAEGLSVLGYSGIDSGPR